MEKKEHKKVDIPEDEIKRLARKIVTLEGRNLKTKNFTDTEIVSEIEKKIKEAVKCYFNR